MIEAEIFDRAQEIAQTYSLSSLRSLLSFDKKASTGNRFFACTREGKPAVLKLGGLTTRSLDEIAGNNSAYAKMAQLGLSDYSPLLVAGEDFQILDFLEYDFSDMVRLAEEPVEVYKIVRNHLRNIYFKTMMEDRNTALIFLRKVFGDEPQRRYLEQYLCSNGLIRAVDVELLSSVQARFEKVAPKYVTFTAGGELQPEHLRFSSRQSSQPKIIDPREPLAGNPIIEVAILSELFGLYDFKNAKEGKDIMYGLINELGATMQMTQAQVQCLIALGKIRQGTLSARFRFKENPLQAKEQADKVVKSMEEIINANL